MAFGDDQFNILIKTTADTSGIQQTSKGLDDLKTKAEKPISVPAAPAAPPLPIAIDFGTALGSFATGLIGAFSLMTPALMAAYQGFSKLNAEQDKWADGIIKTLERVRDMQQNLQETTEWATKLSLIRDMPLVDRVAALQHELTRVKTEFSLVNQSTEEGVKAAAKYQNQINQLTDSLRSAKEAQEKLNISIKNEAETFLPNAIKSASAQTQAVLKNEREARDARAEGRDIEAEQFEKTAEQLKASMKPEQLEELRQIKQSVSQPIGRPAGAGESQDILDQIALNQLNFQRQLEGQPPATMEQARKTASGETDLTRALDGIMSKYWGP